MSQSNHAARLTPSSPRPRLRSRIRSRIRAPNRSRIRSRILAIAAQLVLALPLASIAQPVGQASAKRVAPIDPSRLRACPFEPDDLKAAFGFGVKAGKVSELNPKGGRMLDCSYSAASGPTTVTVSQTWLDPQRVDATMASIDRYSNSRPEPLAGDADRGRWLIDPVRQDVIALQYLRNNVRTEIRVLVGSLKPDAVRAALIKLKRVP